MIAVACAVAALAATARAGEGTFPGANGQILFNVQWPAKLDFGDVNPDALRYEVCGVGPGTASRRWTVSGEQVLEVNAVAAPGQSVVAVTSIGMGAYVAFVDATHRLPVYVRSGGASDWSPDGRSLLYVDAATPQAPFHIFVLDVQSRAVTQLTSDPANAAQPRWSPDGSRIAFASDRTGSFQIWVMDTDGGNQHVLTSGPGQSSDPSWSPDGTRIAFSSTRAGPSALYTMAADGSGVAPVGAGVPGTSPVWSPDGTQIAFARNQHLHVIRVDGSDDRLAYPGLIEGGPSDWAPQTSLPPGPPCIRWGTDSADRIAGTRFDDVVLGRAGADRIALGAGDDQAIGYAGSDTIDGGPGADWIEGDEGSDRLTGGLGADHLFGGPGDDTIYARDGVRDWVSCGPGRDTVYADRIDVVARDCERVRRG